MSAACKGGGGGRVRAVSRRGFTAAAPPPPAERGVTRYVIAYDIVSNRKRSRLAKLLLDYGRRVQKSVFEADLSKAQLEEIMGKAAKYVSGVDSLRFYPACLTCCSAVRCLGRQDTPARADFRII
ncbi:MAG TPA: CRISPR-associated endonuclease Cas2 [Chthonomonadales bacterium]|nr:CRISPR-associated endonuclease Cas2 [Chthonomonadales bacterium]